MNNEGKIRRTIMIFPQFENTNIINEIRDMYDPLANHVRPHITLVFTFESSLCGNEIKQHLEEVLGGYGCFKLTMQNIIKIDNPLGKYLFLDISEGSEQIKDLSEKLYTGILSSFKPSWLNNKTFSPHITLGNFSTSDELNLAYMKTEHITESFTTTVDKISVEVIAENEDSIIEAEVILAKWKMSD